MSRRRLGTALEDRRSSTATGSAAARLAPWASAVKRSWTSGTDAPVCGWFVPPTRRQRAILDAAAARSYSRRLLLHDHARHVERLGQRSGTRPRPVRPRSADAFAALRSFPDFRGNPSSLPAWLNRITVHTARRHIRQRRVRHWLTFSAPAELPDVPSTVASPAVRAALASVHALLERMPSDERVALSLRFVGQLGPTEVADATGFSLATAKRCLGRARDRFLKHGQPRRRSARLAGGERRWTLRAGA